MGSPIRFGVEGSRVTAIRTQREERAEGIRVPVFGLFVRGVRQLREWLRRKEPKRRYYEAPRPDRPRRQP